MLSIGLTGSTRGLNKPWAILCSGCCVCSWPFTIVHGYLCHHSELGGLQPLTSILSVFDCFWVWIGLLSFTVYPQKFKFEQGTYKILSAIKRRWLLWTPRCPWCSARCVLQCLVAMSGGYRVSEIGSRDHGFLQSSVIFGGYMIRGELLKDNN